MRYTVLSLFPEIISAYFSTSIAAKAVGRGLLEYSSVNIRDFALDRHKTCDDSPYGGGPGMLMLAEPLARTLESVGVQKKGVPNTRNRKVIYLTPSGIPFNQEMARDLAQMDELVLVCGRYEGIDQRVIDMYVDAEISVGDYVLSCGEAAALVIIDATYRLVEQVITPESLDEESFGRGLLEYPQYTRPEIFDTLKVPDILLSGHHENIRRWRLEKQVEKTMLFRPDLIRQGLENGLFDMETRNIIKALRGAAENPSEPAGRRNCNERDQGD